MRRLALTLLLACGAPPPVPKPCDPPAECTVLYPCCNIYGEPTAARCACAKPLECESDPARRCP